MLLCIVLHRSAESLRNPRPDILRPCVRLARAFLREHERRLHAESPLRTAMGLDRQTDARPADPGRPEPKLQNVAKSARRVKVDADRSGGNARAERAVQRLEGNAEALREPLLHHRGDHLEIAGIEHDAGGIAVLEADLLLQREIAQDLACCFKRKRWTLPVCVFGSASMKTTERGYL